MTGPATRGPWRIDTDGQTLVFASDGGVPSCVYWGATLPDREDLGALVLAQARDLTGGMLDRLPSVSLCPGASGDSFQGKAGLVVLGSDARPLSVAMRLDSAIPTDGGIAFVSSGDGLTLTHSIAHAGPGVLRLTTHLASDRAIRVLWLAAPVLPGPQAADTIIDVSGRWTSEFQLNRVPWAPGMREREARTGRSGHEHPPFALFPESGANDTAGVVFGMAYGWPGGHRMVAEELADGRRQVQWGHAIGAWHEPDTAFQTAPLYIARSDTGLNGIARIWQRFVRDTLAPWPDPARPRPVHYNCWEAVYFDHRLDALSEIATRAAALGAERFVLDDGWFGRRDDDTSSLGDWTVDRAKWPDGLHPLIAHVRSLGMTFGLWVEPEMVNPDSDLYRAHPDWALGLAEQVKGRGQMVLNLGRPDVRDHLFGVLSALLAEYPIDYLKWDHNRLLPVVDASQGDGVLDLLARLRAAHQGVEIESCASGGGRIDFGILGQTHRVWLSDSNDALERLRIQHDAALFLPAAVTGSHVGPRQSHTSGRVLAMAFRAWVAAQRHMGFEMDLRELTDGEAEVLANVTAWWKENRHWTMQADILRLPHPDPAVTAEVQVAADGERFVVFAGQNAASPQVLPRPLRLTGLDLSARYRVRLVNLGDAPRQSRGPVALKAGTLVLTGAALMQAGVQLPVAWPATMWVVEGERL